MSAKTPATTHSSRQQPAATAPGKSQACRQPPQNTSREEDRGRFRDLLAGPEVPAEPPAAPRPGAPASTGQLTGPALAGSDGSAGDAAPQALAPRAAQPIDIDRVLAQQARGVQLATDGQNHHVLRFEVVAGDFRGTQLTVSSEGGVVSASAVAPSAELTRTLEQALESARLSLEARGIDLADVDVRSGADNRDRHATQGEPLLQEEEGPGASDARRRKPPQGRTEADAVDYFI